MKRKFIGLSLAAISTSLALAPPAHAAQIFFTVEGTTGENSYDTLNDWGGSISSVPYSASFTFTWPTAVGSVVVDMDYWKWYEGWEESAPLTGALTINGVTKTFDNPYYSYISKANNWSGEGGWIDFYINPDISSIIRIYSYGAYTAYSDTIDLFEPFDFEISEGNNRDGFYINGTDTYISLLLSRVTGSLTDPNLPLTPVEPIEPNPVDPVEGAVPEPSTWLLLLTGFGAVGGMLRNGQRRKTRIAVSYA